ncbi:hypothetical protein HK101_001775 [Irineochytrium annulatum]|nr:hypothetical protein HK101_001775 [Irineochytrium annulatum]
MTSSRSFARDNLANHPDLLPRDLPPFACGGAGDGGVRSGVGSGSAGGRSGGGIGPSTSLPTPDIRHADRGAIARKRRASAGGNADAGVGALAWSRLPRTYSVALLRLRGVSLRTLNTLLSCSDPGSASNRHGFTRSSGMPLRWHPHLQGVLCLLGGGGGEDLPMFGRVCEAVGTCTRIKFEGGRVSSSQYDEAEDAFTVVFCAFAGIETAMARLVEARLPSIAQSACWRSALESALMTASARGQHACVRYLLNVRKTPSPTPSLSKCNGPQHDDHVSRSLAFQLACEQGHVSVVETFLDTGAVEIRGDEGDSDSEGDASSAASDADSDCSDDADDARSMASSATCSPNLRPIYDSDSDSDSAHRLRRLPARNNPLPTPSASPHLRPTNPRVSLPSSRTRPLRHGHNPRRARAARHNLFRGLCVGDAGLTSHLVHARGVDPKAFHGAAAVFACLKGHADLARDLLGRIVGDARRSRANGRVLTACMIGAAVGLHEETLGVVCDFVKAADAGDVDAALVLRWVGRLGDEERRGVERVLTDVFGCGGEAGTPPSSLGLGLAKGSGGRSRQDVVRQVKAMLEKECGRDL